MDHASIEELVPAYALGAIDPAESQAVEAHLPTCPACRALLASYSDLSRALLYATPPMSAPRGMAERMQRRLLPPQQDVASTPWWTRLRSSLLVSGLALAVLLLVTTNVYWFSRTSGLQHQVAEQASLVASLTDASAISLQADAPAPNAQGVVYASAKGQIALLCVYGMPELPSDKAYQVWLSKMANAKAEGCSR